MAYQTEIVSVKQNDQNKWAKKVPEGGVYWDEGSKSYYFRDPVSGLIQRTAGFSTAYSAAGIETGTPSDIRIAQNQKFKLGSSPIQYDTNTQTYYFKDPVSGQLLTTSNLATAYGVLYPTTTTPGGDPTQIAGPGGSSLTYTGETPPSGYRPSATSKQFFQPVYTPAPKDFTTPGYSLMGDQSGLGALDYVQQINTAGNAPLDLQGIGPQGIGAIKNPFAYTPENYRSEYEKAMEEAKANLGSFTGLGSFSTPFSTADK